MKNIRRSHDAHLYHLFVQVGGYVDSLEPRNDKAPRDLGACTNLAEREGFEPSTLQESMQAIVLYALLIGRKKETVPLKRTTWKIILHFLELKVWAYICPIQSKSSHYSFQNGHLPLVVSCHLTSRRYRAT